MRGYKTIFIIICILLSTNIYGYIDDGKHPMTGNSIFPLTDVNIKLSEIQVSMERKENDIATKITTEYILENLSDKEVNFNVAFPIESNCPRCTRMPEDFKVSINNKPIQTFTGKIIEKEFLLRISKEISLKHAERQVYSPKKISDMKHEIPLIIWKMFFKPKERKIITTAYTTEWGGGPGSEHLMYDLSTLSLWKGNIEKAYIKLILPQKLIDNIKTKDISLLPKITISPKKYRIKNNTIEWLFKDLNQKKVGYISVDIVYYHTTKDLLQKDKFEGEIVFDRAYGGFHIFKINGSDPDKEIQLTIKDSKYYENNVAPKWSPDGKYIAYVSSGPNEKSNIFIMESDGNNKRNITNLNYGIISNMKWDKTGNEIRFTYNPNKPGEEIVERAVNIRTRIIRNLNTEEELRGCAETIPSPNEKVLLCYKWLMPGNERITVYQKETSTGSWTEKIMLKIKKLLYGIKKDQERVFYKENPYKKKKEFILEDASGPLWSRDSLKFVILISDYLAIFDKDGNEIARLINDLCKYEGPPCLRSWSYDSNKILYSCYCGAEGIQEKIYLIDLETKKSSYITEGQNPDWYFDIR